MSRNCLCRNTECRVKSAKHEMKSLLARIAITFQENSLVTKSKFIQKEYTYYFSGKTQLFKYSWDVGDNWCVNCMCWKLRRPLTHTTWQIHLADTFCGFCFSSKVKLLTRQINCSLRGYIFSVFPGPTSPISQ